MAGRPPGTDHTRDGCRSRAGNMTAGTCRRMGRGCRESGGTGRQPPAAPIGLSAWDAGKNGPGQERAQADRPPAWRQRQPRRRWQLRQGKSRSSSFLSRHGRKPRGTMFGNMGGRSKSFVAQPVFHSLGRRVPGGLGRGESEPPGLHRLEPEPHAPSAGTRSGSVGIEALPRQACPIDFAGANPGQGAFGEIHHCGGRNPS